MKYNLQPTLEDQLVMVRPLTREDFPQLFSVASDPLIWEQHPSKNRYLKVAFEKFFEDAINSKGAFLVIDKRTSQIIGSTRFKVCEKALDTIEIGWTFLSREYWGGIYNKSVKSLLINYAFQHFETVLFNIGENNIRSQKAVEKIGAKKVIDPNLNSLFCSEINNVSFIIKKNDWILKS